MNFSEKDTQKVLAGASQWGIRCPQKAGGRQSFSHWRRSKTVAFQVFGKKKKSEIVFPLPSSCYSVNGPGPFGNDTASLACEGSMTAAQRKQLRRWRKLDDPSMFSHVALARTMNSPWEPRSSTILLDLLSRVYSVYTALTRQRMKWGGSVYLSI